MGANPIVSQLLDLQNELHGISHQLDIAGSAALSPKDDREDESLNWVLWHIRCQVDNIEEKVETLTKIAPNGGE